MNESDLMTHEDVIDVLQLAALDICIKHWKENLAFFKEHLSIPRGSIHSSTCALCIINTDGSGRVACEECILGIHQGMDCNDDDSTWFRVACGDTSKDTIAAMKDMIKLLEEVERNNEVLEILVYCGNHVGLPALPGEPKPDECEWSITLKEKRWKWESREVGSIICGNCKSILDPEYHMEVKDG